MSEDVQAINPHPKALQEKFQRIGWDDDSWIPTPGVSDEATELYLTIHMHAMSVEEALSLSDEEFSRRLWEIIFHPKDAIEEYDRRQMQ